MSWFKKKILAVGALATLTSSIYAAEFITIGTGGVTGTYYPTGGAICKLVNIYKKETKIRCSLESTDGSVYNINALNFKELDFGIAQSDVIYEALNGTGKFKNEPVKKLKAVMAIYPELLTLVTRKDSNIKTIYDIKDKKINIGNPGSGNEATVLTLLNKLDMKISDLAYAGQLKSSEMPDALRDRQIDGYFYMVGHPTANIKDAANSTDISITPISNKKIDELIKEKPYFAKANVPAGLYKGSSKDVPTFGVKAVLVTSEDVSEKSVYTVVKAIMENFDKFKRLHPAYNNITKESLLDGITAPLHDGAKKYYIEKGIIK